MRGFSLLKTISSSSSQDLGCFKDLSFLSFSSSRRSTTLGILFANSLKVLLTCFFFNIKANFFENLLIFLVVFEVFKRCCIVLSSKKSSSVLPSFHRSVLLSFNLVWKKYAWHHMNRLTECLITCPTIHKIGDLLYL